MMKNKQTQKTLSGKTGKDLLNLVDSKSVHSVKKNVTAPVSETEIALFNFWKNLLGHDNFGVNDDFFQIGGNSLKAIQFLSRISKEFSVNLETTDVFLQPTISQLATLIQNRQKTEMPPALVKIHPKPDRIPLSFSQERLWFIDHIGGSLPYHVSAVLRLKGNLNIPALENSINAVVNRHDILRTVIHEENEKAYQSVKNKDEWKLNFIEGSSYNEDSDAMQNEIQKLINKPFDLSNDFMLRASLISVDKNEHILALTMHHISSDALSLAILIKEATEFYKIFVKDGKPEIPEQELQYSDFAVWQRNFLAGEILDNKLKYWKKKLVDLEPLQLPVDFKRPEVLSTKGAVINFSFDKKLTKDLQSISSQYGSTLFMTLQAAFKILMHRYSGQNDISVGTSIANRTMQEVENLIGFFVNTLALRDEVNDNESFAEFLKNVKATTVEAFDHQDIPFEKVVDAVVKERDPSRTPLFQVMLVQQYLPDISEYKLGKVKLLNESFDLHSSKFEITFFVSETANGLKGTVEYSTDLFKEETINRMVVHFKELLCSVVKNPEEKVRKLGMVSEKEEKELLKVLAGMKVRYPKKSVVDLFGKQVMESAEKVAVVFEDQSLTYRELHERSNILAHYLISKGVKEETLVPLYTERSVDMIIGMLGIMKAGGGYVPVDTDLPVERIEFFLEDTIAEVIVCSKKLSSNLSKSSNLEIVEIDEEFFTVTEKNSSDLKTKVSPEQLAYVIYTSGSTGNPKGVMIEHRNLVDYVYGLEKNTNINECKSFALVSTIATDLGNTVIYASLLSGGTLHLFKKESVSNSEFLQSYFKKNEIECLKIVPSHWKALCSDENILLPKKLLVFGGEALRSELIGKIKTSNSYLNTDCKIVNHYGPTETTIGKLLHNVDNKNLYDNTIPIGKPFSNSQVYVLSKEKKLCPIGVPGELFIAGDGIARGYLNNDELTKQKFVENPFVKVKKSKDLKSKTSADTKSLMYGTGDLVKLLPDGNIEFIGRVDDQVKIRGYRIELGEIERTLNECDLVKESVVIAKEDNNGNKRLIGYVVTDKEYSDDFKTDRERIVNYLKEKLPDYMIPGLLTEIENIPLTANGKIDKKALPDPDVTEQLTNEYLAPRNEAEKVLTEIWQELLDLDTVGIHDNFFELGGDSIITIQLVSRARRAGFELQVGDVFTYQTIARLSALLDQRSEKESESSGEQFILTGESGLLPIQQWFFEKSEGNSHKDISHFNQSVLLGIDKVVNESIIKRSIEQIKSQHDALRFKYYKKDNEWHQVYEPESEVSGVITEDLSEVKGNEELKNFIKQTSEKYQKSLDIEKGELIRVVWLKTPESETHNRLLIVIHHLAIDGVSWRILLEDLELLITGLKSGGKTDLGKKGSSYRQWFETLQKFGQSERLLNQRSYWENVSRNITELPSDKEYEVENNLKIRAKDILNLSTKLGEKETKQLLQDVPAVYHTEINDILLSALAKTISGYNKTNKVTIELEGHGREDLESENETDENQSIDTTHTVGWFTTHYPVLFDLNNVKEESGLIKSVKEQLRKVPDKGIGYGVLKFINKEKVLQNTKDPDIIFNYLGQLDNVLGNSQWFKTATESAGSSTSEEYVQSNKISVNAIVQNNELILNWSYSKNHFKNETIEKIANTFKANLESLIVHCLEKNKTGKVFTPSDYGLGKEISYTELDNFSNVDYKGNPRSESIEGIYRLSGLQQGMLFHGLYESGADSYIRQLSCEVMNIDMNLLKKSWNVIFKKHSILRSAFYYDEFGIPVQCVYKEVEMPVEVLDLRKMNDADQKDSINKFALEDSTLKKFDFKVLPLMRVSLLRLSDERYRMFWTWHHILFDGWSMQILLEEFLNTYEQLIAGKEVSVTETDRYEDFIRYIERRNIVQQKNYWKNYMKGIEHNTVLPFVSSALLRTKSAGVYETSSLKIDSGKLKQIENFIQSHHITLNTLIQGVWSVLLHQYTGNSDITFGVVVSGRPDDLPEVEKRVGMFINTIPFRNKINEDFLSAEWLQKIQEDQVMSRNFQFTPLNEILGMSDVMGDLFDSILVFENYPVSKLAGTKQWSLQVSNLFLKEQANYPLSVIVSNSGELIVDFNFNTIILKKEYVNEIKSHFENVLLQIISNEDKSLNKIELLSESAKSKLLVEFIKPDVNYPKDKTLVDLFEEQAAKFSDNIAVVFENSKQTYKELNERSNQLANFLQSKGVKNESLVPVCIERSHEMIIGILAVLKAGGAYVPVDPDYPGERIKFMIEDSGSSVVLSSKECRSKLPVDEKFNVIEIDGDQAEISKQSSENLKTKIDSHNAAYVIYTSGSTGKPKGVIIEHYNVVRLFKNDTPLFDFSEKDVWTLFHSFCFDFSVWEMYGALFFGGKLVIVPREVTKDTSLYAELLINEKVTVLNQTPSAFYVLQDIMIEKAKSIDIRYVIFGGEALVPAKVQAWKQAYPDCKLINMYGITETTVHVTYQELQEKHLREESSVIGKPIPTLNAYILNSNMQLVPAGVAGELYIGGSGLARGYLNQPELTKERFVKNPFSKDSDSMLYRTGDLGRWLPDGSIEYLGRIDEQVKIRGFRIELGEIESVLNEVNSIKQSVVLAHGQKNGIKRLVGYIVTEGEFEKEKVLSHLRIKLPEYMVPQIWVELDKLPLTSNGKIDRKALPDPEAGELLRNEYVAPRNETEEKLAAIWCELLGLEKVGVHDNFFELGGHSLMVTRVVSAIRKDFSLNIPIKTLFEFISIEDIANYIDLIRTKDEKVTASEAFDL